ncbi:IS110 family transposase [Rhodococcus qingshengii]|uniref:IS110 family transposase n=1 Tax=Rhodococcus TaxID=1827 RepID=UPI001BAF76C0|nr:transposase [Rhodococcus qingshengii]MBS3694063.1 transposase [Rhodococcus qingshengii]
MKLLWAGIDAGKAHHHCVVIDSDGTQLFSRRVANDEADLSTLVDSVPDRDRIRIRSVDGAQGGVRSD